MRKFLAVVFLSAMFALNAFAVTVTFQDAALLSAVRAAINKPSGAITDLDLKGLNTLIAPGLGIKNLSGLEYCVNLHKLDISNNSVTDLSPIAGLTKLNDLNISNNDITSIAALANMGQMKNLNINNNAVIDIAAIAGMDKIQSLDLSGNMITDITPLLQNPGISGNDNVNLSYNPISDPAQIATLGIQVTFVPPSPTATPTFTDTYTFTYTETPTPTYTKTYTPTFTYTPTPAWTAPACWTDSDGTGIESMSISSLYGNTATFPKVVMDNNGYPAIVWREEHKGSVGVMGQLYYRKWNGSAWADINGQVPGNAQITNETDYIGAYYYFDMKFGTDNNPNILFRRPSQYGNSNVFMKWNGSAWVGIDGTPGGSVLPMAANVFMGKNQLAIDSQNNPHVCWCTNNRINYLKWNGTAWVDADGAGIESASIADALIYDPSMALDANDRPCISFNSDSNYLGFLRWNGSAWVDADGTGTESMNIYPCQLAINELKLDSNGNPCIGFSPYQFLYYIKWNGSEWTDADGIGTESVKVNLPESVSFGNLCLDPSNNPYISYATGSQMTTAGIVRWNGSGWTGPDGSGLESRIIGVFPDPWGGLPPDMALDKSGVLHVVSAPAYRYVYYLRNACYAYPTPAATMQGANIKTDPAPAVESLAADSTYGYPNPCVDSVTIRFVLAVPADTRISISDICGKPVWNGSLGLYDTRSGVNSIVWNTVNDNGARVSNGTYLVSISALGKTVTKKIAVSR